MKFKAILTDQLCMKDFHNIILTFARLSKRVTFIIKETGLYVSNVGTGITINPTAWSEIGKDGFFTHFNMKGIDDEFKDIWLTLYPEQFSAALNTLKTNFVKVIVIKLTKKQFPCLSIDLETAPPNSNIFRRLVHDVPVTIIPVREWAEYQFPVLQNYDVSIQLPTLKSLRALCDKMKNLSATMNICCITSGDLSFIVETDSAIVVSRYFNLFLDETVSGVVQNGDKPLEICTHIDTKQLSTCFASIQLPNASMVGNMIQDEVFNIKISVRENVSLILNMKCVDCT